jgi:hypothetical protein
MNQENSGKARGGLARAAKLTQEERREIARKAAQSRWDSNIPKATHLGKLSLAGVEIPCAVLEDGTRVLSERSVANALGKKGSGAHWQKKKGAASNELLPEYVSIKPLDPFISDETRKMLLNPISYKAKTGPMARGIPATLLLEICQIWLMAREKGALANKQLLTAAKAEILMRGFAHVGIVALVDEATGYQKDRARDELSKILEAFVAKELQPWVKTFQSEFYEQLFRLRGLPYPGNGVKRPQYFGYLTNDIIYYRLAPYVWKELKDKAEKDEKGRMKYRLHQKLTPELGHPKLRDLLASVTTIMKLSDQWHDFKDKLDRIHPSYNETMRLPFDMVPDDGKGI